MDIPLRNVSDIFEHYRCAIQTVWNVFFWNRESLRNWDSVTHFRRVKRDLFLGLVLEQIGLPAMIDPSFDESGVPFLVVPTFQDVDFLIAEERPASTIWRKEEPGQIAKGDARLIFRDYFDFQQLEHRDFKYYRVRIIDFPARPGLVGKDALIEVERTDVFLDESWLESETRRWKERLDELKGQAELPGPADGNASPA